MTNRTKTIIAAASITALAVIFLVTTKKKVHKEKLLAAISDEGYETAHDILAPLSSRAKRYWI